MRLRVLAVGQKMPAWIDQGVDEYARRLPKGRHGGVVEYCAGQTRH
jgi:23S rRNA (pseudouridine1915-N3)-methyltransferase